MIVSDSRISLKSYASFLKEYRLEEASAEYLRIARDIDLPLLKFFTHLSEPDLLAFIKESLSNLLQQIQEDKFIETTLETLEKWKKDQLPGIPKQEVKASDLIHTYTVRKFTLMNFLPDYTTNLADGITIIQEIERIFSYIQTLSIETYSSIHKQEVEERKNFAELLINNSSDAIVAFNKDACINVWNKAMEERSGIPASDAIGKKIEELQSYFISEAETLALQNVWQGKTTKLSAVSSPTGNNFYNFRLVPLIQQDTIVGGVKFTQDITESKQKERSLLEFQEELQTMNEELQESREEYIAANEELTESHEKLLETIEKINQQYEQLLQLQKELEESEARYRLLALNASDVITAYAADGTYSFVSDASRDVLGFDPDSLIGQDPLLLVHPEDCEEVRRAGLRLAEDNKAQKVEFRILTKGGSYRWMETYIRFAHFSDQPEKKEIQASTRDIHERKEAELALSKERNYLSTILENIDEGIVACNEKGEITYSNIKSSALQNARNIGLPLTEWNTFFKLHYPDGTPVTDSTQLPLYRALHGETVKNMHLLGVDDSKKFRHFVCNAQQLVNPDGSVRGAIIVTRDITNSMEAEKQLENQHLALRTAYKELQEAKQALQTANTDLEKKVLERTRSLEEINQAVKDRELLLDTIINATPALISYISAESKYQLVNKAYLDWFDIKEDELVGQSLAPFMSEKVKNHPGAQAVERVLAGIKQKFEIELLHHDGTWRQVEVQYTPHVQANGEVPGFVALIIDLTEMLQSKKELEEKNKQLQKINIDLDNFIYTASHDLKAPISNIEGLFSQLNKRLAHTYGDTENLIIKMVQNSIQKFRTTIQYLTEISRVDHEVETAREVLLFRQSIEDVLFDISPLIAEANPKISFELEEETVLYTPKNLRSIIYNLISNSLKYRSPDRPAELKIRTYLEEGRTVFELQDNGLGMDEHQLSKLFAMFRRFHNHVEGTGVGLFIIKRIIENYGGRIEVKSAPDKGSQFKVIL